MHRNLRSGVQLIGVTLMLVVNLAPASAQTDQPNILVIFGNDVGMWNISAYHRGMMGGSTPSSQPPSRPSKKVIMARRRSSPLRFQKDLASCRCSSLEHERSEV